MLMPTHCCVTPFAHASIAVQVPPLALALGMKVVMFVRTPSKISERYLYHTIAHYWTCALTHFYFSYKAKVESFQGSMDDLDAVRKCVQQHKPDFVMFTAALPRGEPFKPLSSAVIPAM